ncbi:MAG: DUF4062 domain-containing protein, partial [Blastocatellia bacterium]|nr:DUF4062 domain-containing protein [Blastocatellia bacterium]
VRSMAMACGWDCVYFDTVPGIGGPQVLSRIHRDIRSCDVFCILLASRYGSPVPELAISYSHFEFALARMLGMPVIAILLKETETACDKPDWDSPYPKGQYKLKDLYEEIRLAVAQGTCIFREYSSKGEGKDDLRHVASTVLDETRKCFSPVMRDEMSLAPMPKPQESRHRFLCQSIALDRLTVRMEAVAAARLEFSQYFFDYNLPLLVGKGKLNLFFGGGATSSALWSALLRALQWTKLCGLPSINIHTTELPLFSRLITYQLEELNCRFFFLSGRIDANCASVRVDDEMLNRLRSDICRIPKGERGLFLSGISTNQTGQVRADNFKLLEAGCSLGYAGVICLNLASLLGHEHEDDTRIDSLFSIFESPSMQWLENAPVGLCVAGGSKNRRQLIIDKLRNYGFDPLVPSYHDSEYRKSFPVLATNKAFQNSFGVLIG